MKFMKIVINNRGVKTHANRAVVAREPDSKLSYGFVASQADVTDRTSASLRHSLRVGSALAVRSC